MSGELERSRDGTGLKIRCTFGKDVMSSANHQTLLFRGGDLHTRVDSRLFENIFPLVFRSEKIREYKEKKKEKKEKGRREATTCSVFTKIFHYTRESSSFFLRILGHRWYTLERILGWITSL